jgi:hypothetical protein
VTKINKLGYLVLKRWRIMRRIGHVARIEDRRVHLRFRLRYLSKETQDLSIGGKVILKWMYKNGLGRYGLD